MPPFKINGILDFLIFFEIILCSSLPFGKIRRHIDQIAKEKSEDDLILGRSSQN